MLQRVCQWPSIAAEHCIKLPLCVCGWVEVGERGSLCKLCLGGLVLASPLLMESETCFLIRIIPLIHWEINQITPSAHCVTCRACEAVCSRDVLLRVQGFHRLRVLLLLSIAIAFAIAHCQCRLKSLRSHFGPRSQFRSGR